MVENRVLEQHPVGDMPYEVVAAAFTDFRVPEERGGYPTGKTPLMLHQTDEIISSKLVFSPHYDRQSSFTPEQRAYITTSLGYYNGLLDGKAFTLDPNSHPSLSSRIQQHLQVGSSFSRSMLHATREAMGDFSRIHPNLMPAFHAAFAVAGAEGSALAIELAAIYLNSGKAKGLLEARGHVTRRYFIGPHNRDGILDYEVVCVGERVAQTMLYEAMQAANAFLSSPIRMWQEFEVGQVGRQELHELIQRESDGLMEEVAANYEEAMTA